MNPRRTFLLSLGGAFALAALATWMWPPAGWSFAVLLPIAVLGARDLTQKRHTILRNFPVIGHFRYLFEAIRPEINQYFVESDTDGVPFSRNARSVVYQRAKRVLDTRPFGTQIDVYAPGHEWIEHSMLARTPKVTHPRILVGGPHCEQPYFASVLNVSAMSFGALSDNAVRALSHGAKLGGFAVNTGEGGVSAYHLEGGADLIWQLGTGYFGARTADGAFDPERFAAQAARDEIKMIEIKLSQGAKPGHGGILPAAKLTPELAQIRGVPLGQDVLSPPAHSAFRGPTGLLNFVARLRDLSGGKPVGFKICIGRRHEFLAICKAMLRTGITPDYIAVDGAEGGTGAAPLEFADSMGYPLTEALIFVDDALRGCGLRDRIRVFASGKIVTGFGLARAIALGADAGYSARGMMMALGCIQALRCNSNACPAGVATQDPHLVAGLVPEDKAHRVHGFHEGTVHALAEIAGAAGLDAPAGLTRRHLHRRFDATNESDYERLYPTVASGAFLRERTIPPQYAEAWAMARADSFEPADLDEALQRAA